MKKATADRVLWALFGLTMAAYGVVFVSAFSQLPLNIPSWHQGLLLYSHLIPMFFLQLILCRRARVVWRFAVPLVLLAVPVLVFVAIADWDARAWVLAGVWCIAPVLGCALAWLVWGLGGLSSRRRRS